LEWREDERLLELLLKLEALNDHILEERVWSQAGRVTSKINKHRDNTELEEELEKKFEPIKLEKVEDNSLIFRVAGPIFHKINMKGEQVGHFIKSEVPLSWLPTLSDFELLASYFKFLRALCEVTKFPPKQDKVRTLWLAKIGEINLIKLCKTLYGKDWDQVLTAFKHLHT